MNTYPRFELAFDGEPQGVGFMTGLEDVGLPTHIESQLHQPFDDKLESPIIRSMTHEPVEFWFTDLGLETFWPAIRDIARKIAKYDWSLLYIFEEKDALHILAREHSGEIELFSLSAYLSEVFMAVLEKNDWLDRVVPCVPADHRLFCLCGTDKKAVVPDGVQTTDLLLDDYTLNLNSWSERGHAVKVLNGINDTSGSWDGERISIDTTPELLAEQIYALAMA